MRAYERLLQYVKVYTTSDPTSGTHPSTQRQFDLARMLVDELHRPGLWRTPWWTSTAMYTALCPPPPAARSGPALGLIAHMDTAPDAPGENVQPVLHEHYDGRDVTLPATGAVMKVATSPSWPLSRARPSSPPTAPPCWAPTTRPAWRDHDRRRDAAADRPRPTASCVIAFTPDEEIGEGASLFDLERFGADFAYTVDGGDVGGIEYENFNAASATVTVHGLSVHTGSAKNTMVNAANVAMEFHLSLPRMARPETTEGREGFTTCARWWAT